MYIIQNDCRSDFYLENARNALTRRCRIKNVRHKPVWPYRPQTPMPAPLDIYRFIKPLNDFTDPCAGCLGKACGNVACPKRAVVTC